MKQIGWGTLVGLAAATLMTVLVALRYAHNPSGVRAAELAPALIPLAAAALLAWRGLLRRDHEPAPGAALGAWTGVLTGLLWVGEIGFNNFGPHAITTARVRMWVDDGAWALIALLILAASAVAAWRAGSYRAAVRCGLWGGLVSGTIACLMGELLVLAWMPALLSDPLNIEEYAEVARQAGAPAMATYFAWETLTGALGHLVVLGVAMGGLLGLLGGVAAVAPRRR